MIMGQLRFASRYYDVHPRLQAACEFLMREDLNRPAGTYEIDGRNIVALFQEYETQAPNAAPWETHNYHYDVQYLVEGRELIGYGRRDGTRAIQPYNAKDDYDIIAAVEGDYYTLTGDGFAVLFPEDAHQPRVFADSKPMKVKKICIKVLI